jgi:hypothetical protein
MKVEQLFGVNYRHPNGSVLCLMCRPKNANRVPELLGFETTLHIIFGNPAEKLLEGGDRRISDDRNQMQKAVRITINSNGFDKF